ncbi:MAG TPA: hypothetical protein VFY54_22385, partial [Rubrobacter sp.]|nr:hypothetical protein [Rubrobacter sp.]
QAEELLATVSDRPTPPLQGRLSEGRLFLQVIPEMKRRHTSKRSRRTRQRSARRRAERPHKANGRAAEPPGRLPF